MFNIALYQPDIPQNTAAIIRLCSCFDVTLEIIEPCGFHINDKRLKKAKMLNALGMKVASISIMCDDPLVFDAMYRSSTPCPVLTEDVRSVIGEEAMKIIFERRKPTDDKVEQYRRYKESLTNNGKNPK